MYVYFFKIVSRTQETENLCSWTNLLENNQIQPSVKFMISSNDHDFSRPEISRAFLQCHDFPFDE